MALWEELGEGAPTLVAFAHLCSRALAEERAAALEGLSDEALGILYAAGRRGAIEVKGVNHAFESSERFLTVCVELDLERQLILKRRDDPELTIRFLDGFRQLCAGGLVMHHILRDFSLTRHGFEAARGIRRDQVRVLDRLLEEQVLGEI
jgi:hypothetical protein